MLCDSLRIRLCDSNQKVMSFGEQGSDFYITLQG